MSKPTVTKREVGEALAEFRRQGKPRPGLHRLREVIGHGSLARIQRLVREIDTETIDRLAPELVERIPDPVSVAAAKLWAELEAASDELQQSIEVNLAKAQAVMHDEVSGLRQQLADTTAALQTSQTARAAAEQALAAGEVDRARCQAQLAAAVNAEQHLRAELTVHATAAAEREAALNARLDRERQRGQDEARAARQRETELQGQLDSTRDALAKARESHARQVAAAESDANALHAALRERDVKLKALQEARDALDRQAQAVEKDLARAEARHDAQAAELAELRQALKAAQQRIEELAKASRPAHKKRAAASPRNKKTS